jgi:hypothetical protein
MMWQPVTVTYQVQKVQIASTTAALFDGPAPLGHQNVHLPSLLTS